MKFVFFLCSQYHDCDRADTLRQILTEFSQSTFVVGLLGK